MTKIARIEADTIRDADHRARWGAALRHLSKAIDIAESIPGGQRAIGEALCAALDTVGAGAPRYQVMPDLRDDASFWAEMATPLELEAYAATALRRLGRATLAERARKRLFWALWVSMPDDSRSAFLARVRKESAPP